MERRFIGLCLATVVALGGLSGCGRSENGTAPGSLSSTATAEGENGSSAVITATANAVDGGNPEATTASGSETLNPDETATAAP